jgi:hypothetical protein
VRRALLALAMAGLAGAGSLALSCATTANNGSDDRAMAVAAKMRPGQKLGRRAFGFSPNGPQERFGFALQVSSGVGVFCYAYLGLRKRRSAA